MYALWSLLTFVCPEKQCCKIYFHKFRQIKLCCFETKPSSGQLAHHMSRLYFSVFRLLLFRQFLLYVLHTAGTNDNNYEATHYERGCLVTGLFPYFRDGCWKTWARQRWRGGNHISLAFLFFWCGLNNSQQSKRHQKQQRTFWVWKGHGFKARTWSQLQRRALQETAPPI